MPDKTKPDLIDRAAAISLLREEASEFDNTDECTALCYRAAANILTVLPTIDAALVVHGRWINNGEAMRHCSACGAYYFPYNYCPNCGARMDGGEGHEAD